MGSTSSLPSPLTASSASNHIFDESPDTGLQRLRLNDPNLAFLVVGPATDSHERVGWAFVQKLNQSELVENYIFGLFSKATFISTLSHRGIAEPIFIEWWPGVGFCDALAQNSFLSTLIIHGVDLSSNECKLLSISLATNTSLKSLTLMACRLQEDISDFLITNATLTELNLSSNRLGEAGWTKIGRGLADNSTLTKLGLSDNQLGEVGSMEIGKGLAVNSTLTELNLSSNELGDVGGTEIGKGLAANSTLTELHLSFCKLGNVAGVEIGEGLAVNSTLTQLNLLSNELGDVGGGEIGKGLAVNSTLKVLNLSVNQLGDVGGSAIGEALAVNSTLTELNLSSNKLGEVGGRELGKGLSSNRTLIKLNLASNMLRVAGGMEIGKGLAAHSTLTDLNLSFNQLGDISFFVICNSLSNSPLQILGVSFNFITTIPPSLADSPSLTSLYIYDNPLIEPAYQFVVSASLDQLKAYLRAPRAEILRVRLSVVGYHGVGKTTLTTHLLHPEIQSQEQLDLKMQELKLDASTHGIKTHLLQIPCAELGGKTIKFNTFDFAGQPIYYSNHRHFLGQHRVVYLIVFKSTDSKMEVEKQVNDWCNLIASQIDFKWREMFESGRLPKPSVIVVGTHLNLCNDKEPPIDHEVWFEQFIEDGLYASVFDIQPELLWIDHDAPETISDLLALIVNKGVTQLKHSDSTSPLSSHPSSSSSSSSSSSLLLHHDSPAFALLSHPEIVSRALAEIDRIRGSVSQWRLFYTLEEFQNTVLLGDNCGENDPVRLLINEIGIENLIIQMQAMGEVVDLRKAKKICIEPQRVFDLLADFVHRHHEGSRDDEKQFVDHHMGIVSMDALRNVCTRYNLETRRKFKQQRQVVVLTLEVLIET